MNLNFQENPKECANLLWDVSLTDKDIKRLDKEHRSWRHNKHLQRELFN